MIVGSVRESSAPLSLRLKNQPVLTPASSPWQPRPRGSQLGGISFGQVVHGGLGGGVVGGVGGVVGGGGGVVGGGGDGGGGEGDGGGDGGAGGGGDGGK